MPETNDEPGHGSAPGAGDERHVIELEAEVRRLQGELDRRAGEDLRTWIKAVRDEGRLVRDMQKTLSCRVTRPLRVARFLQLKVAEVGVMKTSQLAVADLRRRYLGRRR